MALNTEISWTDHTLNMWWGCVKISPGCKHCYADTLDNRYNHDDRHWGPGSTRKLVRSWRKNLNDMRKSAIANNRRETVFVMSMGDIFEDDQPLSNNEGTPWKTISDVRDEFFRTAHQYKELIFLLLTKRPENIRKYCPKSWNSFGECPDNVWFGYSVVEQSEVDDIIWLHNAPGANNKFLSMEPLLGPVSLLSTGEFGSEQWINAVRWVIVGGESGNKARPMSPEWARKIRNECQLCGVPFHFKQWGEWDANGNKVGKHASGRLLDGVEYNGLPESFHKPLREVV